MYYNQLCQGTASKVDWESVGKVVDGGAIIVGLGVATVCTGGLVGAVAAGAFAGAAISGGVGAVMGGICSVNNGGTFFEGMADGFLDGTISGAVTGGFTGGIGYGLSAGVGIFNNPLVRETAESVAETAIGAVDTLAHGGTVTAKDLVQDFALNMIMDGGGASKADDLVDVATSKQTRESFESFADLMSPEDAKRYNNFLKNGSDSGLTADELAGIRKVDDQLALNKVDYDEVLEMRKGSGTGTSLGGSDSSNYVYRALNQKDYERYMKGLGLEAKNPNGTWSLKEHLVNGSGKSSWANDPYLSTTSDLSVAKEFNKSGSGYGIVTIDINKVSSKSYKGYEMYPRVNGVEGLPYHYSIWQQETSVYQSIPFDAIVDYIN